MANDCSFWFKAVSRDPEKLHKFLNCWKVEYYYEGEHLFRIFDCIEIVSIRPVCKGLYYAEMSGTCAWSLSSCITTKSGSYYDGVIEDFRKKPETTRIHNKYARNINALCKEYETAIEIFSEEPGCGFSEHMQVDYKGNFVFDEAVDFREYWWDRDNQTIDEFNKETGLNLTEEDFDGEDYYRVGGFDDYSYSDSEYLIEDFSDNCCRQYDFIPEVESYKEIEKFKDFSEEAIKEYKETMKNHGEVIRKNIESRRSELDKMVEADREKEKASVKTNRKGGVI
jgi:hypothetical protein